MASVHPHLHARNQCAAAALHPCICQVKALRWSLWERMQASVREAQYKRRQFFSFGCVSLGTKMESSKLRGVALGLLNSRRCELAAAPSRSAEQALDIGRRAVHPRGSQRGSSPLGACARAAL